MTLKYRHTSYILHAVVGKWNCEPQEQNTRISTLDFNLQSNQQRKAMVPQVWKARINSPFVALHNKTHANSLGKFCKQKKNLHVSSVVSHLSQ